MVEREKARIERQNKAIRRFLATGIVQPEEQPYPRITIYQK
jgi:hypothetical protein